MTVFFTHCTNNFFAQVKTLIDSVNHHEPGFRNYVFLVDQKNAAVDYSAIKAELIVVDDTIVPGFTHMVKKYTLIELMSCLKPMLFQYLVKKYPGVSSMIYLDADTCVYAPFKTVEDILKTDDIILTPHFSTPIPDDKKEPFENVALNYGLYNLGFLAINPTSDNTSKFIEWWSNRSREYGYKDVQNGFFVDQLWCNLVPLFFEKVRVIRDLGYNMAPWNLHERKIESTNGDGYTLSNGEPLVFYHFSSFDYFRPELLSWKYNRYSFEDFPLLKKLCRDYLEKLKKNGIEEYSGLTCSLGYRKQRPAGIARRLLRKAWK